MLNLDDLDDLDDKQYDAIINRILKAYHEYMNSELQAPDGDAYLFEERLRFYTWFEGI